MIVDMVRKRRCSGSCYFL